MAEEKILIYVWVCAADRWYSCEVYPSGCFAIIVLRIQEALKEEGTVIDPAAVHIFLYGSEHEADQKMTLCELNVTDGMSFALV